MALRVAVYGRVSTGDQNCSMQLAELKESCARRGWRVVAEYVDTGWSGVKASRPELDRLMSDARKRQFDIVCVWRFDRFARSTKHLLLALEEFQVLGIEFLSFQESIDTTTPLGRAMFTIVSALAEFERSVITDRVRSGIANARANGKQFGRPRRIFRRDQALRLRAEGKSWRSISKELNVPLSTVVDACTENPSGIEADLRRKEVAGDSAA
jgi:putative DNA-invertase from lambdoid prophage Rac